MSNQELFTILLHNLRINGFLKEADEAEDEWLREENEDIYFRSGPGSADARPSKKFQTPRYARNCPPGHPRRRG